MPFTPELLKDLLLSEWLKAVDEYREDLTPEQLADCAVDLAGEMRAQAEERKGRAA